MKQLEIFDPGTELVGPPPFTGPTFDGATIDHQRDHQRLTSQLQRVRERMSDGQWHNLRELVSLCGGTEASISSRVRDLRKMRFGGHTVERRNVGGGSWEYRLIQA